MEAIEQKKKEIVKHLLSNDILISMAMLDKLSRAENINLTHDLISKLREEKIVLFGEEFEKALDGNIDGIDWMQFDRSKVLHEKGKEDKVYEKFKAFISDPNTSEITKTIVKQKAQVPAVVIKKPSKPEIDELVYEKITEISKEEPQKITNKESAVKSEVKEAKEKNENRYNDVKIVFSYKEEPVKQDIQDFVSYYNRRYEHIERLLRNRPELSGLSSINRVLARREKENVSIIGMVREKQVTKNGNYVLVLEDSTGEIKVLATKNKPDCCETAKNVVFDEVIGVSGVCGGNIVFANKIIFPDVPLNKEIKKLDEEVYAVFLSDMHVGSNNFLPEQFNKFLEWINGNFGSEQHRNMAKKTKYVFIVGDLVDGVGIYPGQESELVINEINEQYAECGRFLSKIPEDIRIIVCAGNHDAMRISEPQLPLYEDFAAPIWALPNTVMVSNPAVVNIAANENFSGLDVLVYHGYSFDYYVANVDYIRQQGGYDRADLIMKFLMQRRHLAPSHKSTLYIADTKKDPLFIEIIPDIFATGHIHKSSVSNYRNITMICGSCWQAKTSFQEKVGHNPEPARVPVVNLQTREVKVLRF